MVEIYCGDGKGKTTAAVGLAVRASAHDIPVLFTQFLKNDLSGEIKALRKTENIQVRHLPVFYGFVRDMTKEQKDEMKAACYDFLQEINLWAEKNRKTECKEDCPDNVIVLDEVLHAVFYGFVVEEQLINLMKKHRTTEFVLTGRNPSDNLITLADYLTEFNKVKHAYDNGVMARKGIEY